jgi:hypothetical protein
MWARLLHIILGVWLMAAPEVLGYPDPARTHDRIIGPVAASMAIIAVWQVARSVRWVHLILGGWLVLAPWVLGYDTAALLHSTAVGALMSGCALVRGKVEQRFGGGWASLWKPGTSNGGD